MREERKTPREVLFAQHAEAGRKIDQIRQAVLSAECIVQNAESGIRPVGAPGLQELLWTRLICPARGTWAALAACWVVILALHMMAPSEERSGAAQARAANVSSGPGLSLRAERQMLDEILASVPRQSEDAEPPRSRMPKSRTENFCPVRFV